jgi:hypothetical protein
MLIVTAITTTDFRKLIATPQDDKTRKTDLKGLEIRAITQALYRNVMKLPIQRNSRTSVLQESISGAFSLGELSRRKESALYRRYRTVSIRGWTASIV